MQMLIDHWGVFLFLAACAGFAGVLVYLLLCVLSALWDFVVIQVSTLLLLIRMHKDAKRNTKRRF